MQPSEDARTAMDRMYRWTRHVYDASRKYYLLGRDKLIKELNAQDGDIICEVGCGTARNLIKIAKAYPKARFYGLDASDEMLKTASDSVKKCKLDGCITLKQAYAQNFDPRELFALERPIDKIVYSYALSIIPPWQEALDHGLELLRKSGEIHIVDFGGMEELPPLFRRFMFWFLSFFHVYHKPEILEHLKSMEAQGKGILKTFSLHGGYAYRAVFIKAG